MLGTNKYTFNTPYVLEYKVYQGNPGRNSDGSLNHTDSDERVRECELLVRENEVTVKAKSTEEAVEKLTEKVASEPLPSKDVVAEKVTLIDEAGEWHLNEESFCWRTGNHTLIREEEI